MQGLNLIKIRGGWGGLQYFFINIFVTKHFNLRISGVQLQLLPPPPPPPPSPKGTVLHSQNCMFNKNFTVQCPAGYKVDSGVCKKCPEGQYQGKINATTCVNCPQFMTTRVIGSTSQSQCFCMYSDVLVFLVLFDVLAF